MTFEIICSNPQKVKHEFKKITEKASMQKLKLWTIKFSSFVKNVRFLLTKFVFEVCAVEEILIEAHSKKVEELNE